MNASGESDGYLLSAKSSNKDASEASAEWMEVRNPAERNVVQSAPPRMQSRDQRGRAGDEGKCGDATGCGDFAAALECVSALRFRSMDTMAARKSLPQRYDRGAKRARAELDPTNNHRQSEQGVAQDKAPHRRVEEKDPVKPMGDEGACVGLVARQFPQNHFQRGERTDNPEPRLQDNQPDANEMCGAEPGIANPFPAAKSPAQDQDQSEHHEQDKGHVRHQDDVREEAVCVGIHGSGRA